MKKFSLIIAIIALMLLFSINVSAKVGDIVGSIYSTDILALINGTPIQSYNIDGKTVIIAEDLINYGYRCDWFETERKLVVSRGYWGDWVTYIEAERIRNERGQVGEILGNIYETDIQVTVNNHEITGYNLNGRTAICIEDLGRLDDSANSQFGYSKYLARAFWNGEERIIELKTPQPDNLKMDFWVLIQKDDTLVVHSFDPMAIYDGSRYEYSPGFRDERYVLKPFYVEIDGEKFEAGIYYIIDGHQSACYELYDMDAIKELIESTRPPRKTYDEAIDYLYDYHAAEYSLYERIDNDDYTILCFLENRKEGAFYDNYIFYAVKKTGGFLKVFYVSVDVNETRPVTMEFSNGNSVAIFEPTYQGRGITGIIHGPGDLDSYPF